MKYMVLVMMVAAGLLVAACDERSTPSEGTPGAEPTETTEPATSNGDALSLEAYFLQLEELFNRVARQSEGVEPGETFAERRDLAREAALIYEGFGIADLEPPQLVASLHHELEEATEGLRLGFAEASLAESEGQLNSVLAGAFAVAASRFNQACRDLQEIAGDNRIAVDLITPGEC